MFKKLLIAALLFSSSALAQIGGGIYGGSSTPSGLSPVVTGLVVGNGSIYAAYAGQTCTNQFARALSASGIATCASVAIGSDVSGLGTGIAAALAINSGSAGAPVLFNAAAGTPTSLTGTNITGTAAGLTSGVATTATGTNALYSATTTVNVSSATAPSSGQILTATSSTAATWQTPVSSAFTTGDVKLTLKNTADSGWIMCNDGTIGNAASGGTTRANADTVDLFTLLWNNVSDTYAAVSTGRGANAAADYAANKTIALTKTLGRAIAIAGSGSGLTARTLGQTLGAETFTLGMTNLPALGGDGGYVWFRNSGGVSSIGTGAQGADRTQGGGTAFSIMPPESFLNMMVKL